MLSIDCKYDSPLHQKILDAVKERKDFSKRKMTNFHCQWDAADDSMRAYIHERDVDRKRKDKKKFEGEVDYVTLEVPYTYAIIMTAHTYYTSVMLSRAPLWQYTARHGATQDSIMAVEAVMDYQLKSGQQLPVLYNWLYDMARYSLGIVGCYWEREEKIVCRYEMQQQTILGVPFGGTKKTKVEEILPGYIGNKLFNVRPYDFYPDPRVAMWKFQEGEFVIHQTSEGYHNLLATAHTNPGYYINLEQLGKIMREKGNARPQGSSRVELPFQPGEAATAPGPGFLTITDAYIKLIPKVWGLGNSNRVEVWCFQIAEDTVVISCKPLGLYHNKFPFSLMEGNFGSEEFAKFGMLEIIKPLTDILTWLVNSHFYNVRRIVNNQLVVDPSKITMKDLTKPGQRVIRLKPNAFGQDVRTAVHQLQMTDVTRTHMGDIAFVEQMIQRVSSVVDNVMGMVNQSGRKTATEVRSSTGYSTSRLKTPVEYNSCLAFDPLSQMMLSNTQQLLDIDRKYAVAGNMLENAQTFLEAGPQQIAGDYDFVSVDGTLPVDRLAQANFWKEMIMQLGKSPMAMQWDMNKLIAHTMKLQGERNIDRFQIKIGSPEHLQQQAQMGNVVPIGGKGGPGPGRAGGAPTGTSGGTI